MIGGGVDDTTPKAKDQGHKRKCSQKKKKRKTNVCKSFFHAISKKKVFKYFFRRSPNKTAQKKIFQPIYKSLTIQKIVLSSSRGQANFRGLEASRPRRQGIDLRGLGQGIQNVSSRPKTSSRTTPLMMMILALFVKSSLG